jgi:hypothetical protein
MGNTTAKNEVESAMKTVASDYTSIYDGTYVSCNASNTVDLDNCTAGYIDINLNNSCSVDSSFNSTVQVQNQVQQCLSSEISQLADAMSQNLTLNPGSTTAENITSQSMSAVDQIKNNITQNCTSSVAGNNTVKCLDGSNIGTLIVNANDMNKSVSNCISNDEIINTSTQSLKSIIDQHSKAVQKNAIFWVIIATAILFISFGISKKLGGGEIIELLILLLIVLAVCALLGLLIWETFNHNKTKTTSKDYCADCRQYTDEDSCNKAMCTWDDSQSQCNCDETAKGAGRQLDCSTQCYMQTDEKSCKDNKCYWDPKKNKCVGDGQCRRIYGN